MYYTGEEQRLERWKDNFKLNMIEKTNFIRTTTADSVDNRKKCCVIVPILELDF